MNTCLLLLSNQQNTIIQDDFYTRFVRTSENILLYCLQIRCSFRRLIYPISLRWHFPKLEFHYFGISLCCTKVGILFHINFSLLLFSSSSSNLKHTLFRVLTRQVRDYISPENKTKKDELLSDIITCSLLECANVKTSGEADTTNLKKDSWPSSLFQTLPQTV